MKNGFLFMEFEELDLELNRLSLRNLSKEEIEYKKYLISKVERLSKIIMNNGRDSEILKLRDILRNFLFNYKIKEYYKCFDVAV
ncbi:hypothetical protein [Clostridium perfringens]|uniref:hypothetical protein n=1 Tax=Clostridium perfringens TaxID=1502 RepID=UPI0022469B4A|nr:hypothetical protein [Clostridium perfringens]MCX0355167.1 hypothetical protein [Clostridium perfringens]MDM0612404.1 hypothetical protein [Clostridium perfringens]MDM0719036.1 hypothetical protein [Clostridium perfringens]